MNVLALYTQTLALTRRMQTAAQNQSWDELSEIGIEREKLVVYLPQRLPSMPESEARQLADIIREILSAHTEIAEHAGPWLKDVGRLLHTFDGETTNHTTPSDSGR